MDRSAELRLPTISVPVRLALVGQAPMAVEVFVADVARVARSQLLDDVAAMIDQEEAFLPVRGGDGVRLFAKQAIAWIAVRKEAEHEVDDELEMAEEVVTLYDRHHRVEVQLLSGSSLIGMLFDS